MAVKYVQGDLFELLPTTPEPKYIPHIVNNIGKMGSGFAKAAFTRFPPVRTDYLDWFCSEESKNSSTKAAFELGATQYVIVQAQPTIIVCNMVAQSGLIGANNPKPIRYAALGKCMMDVRHNIEKCCASASIHAPLFGSKRAGGNPDFIKELIEECWDRIPVTIYLLDDD